MRADMFEVLIERPRSGMRIKHRRGNKPQAQDWDGEDGFEDRVAPRPHRTKFFDDHLQPLRRWLRKQVNRPWDKVYAELCASIDRRSTTGQHLLDHVGQEVARNCVLDADGRVLRDASDHRRSYRGDAVDGLYVHPRTGLLRYTEPRWRAVYRARKQADECMPDDLISLGGDRFLWRRDGLWYEVRARHVQEKRAESLDFKFADPRCCRREHDWHVIEKRQLSTRELRERKLENASPE